MTTATKTRYPTEPLKTWKKSKELRDDFYRLYVGAKDKGGLRWLGGAWTFSAVPSGLGDDVWSVTSEPYAASIAFQKEFSLRCLEATERAGYARDLCSYMRNYWGSIILDEWAFPDPETGKRPPFPKADFIWQSHICCSHAKWYQVVSDLEGGLPMYCVDNGSSPSQLLEENPHALQYVADQLNEGIEWLEKVTGRTFDDEKYAEAVKAEMRSTSAWAAICTENKAVPAPMDEKSMYSYYVHGTLRKHDPVIADFYEEVLAEMRDRRERGVAACALERARVMSDTQPPWGFLPVFRYLEKFGCVSIGSLYTFALVGMWEDQPDGSWGPRKPYFHDSDTWPMNSREEVSRAYAHWSMQKPQWQHFYHPDYKSRMMVRIAKEWGLDGVMLHFNRGCEGLSLGIAENALALKKAGIAVTYFEGNMADEREFDLPRSQTRIDAFMETLELDRLEK
jgi:benzoyl-CoA reductase subunit B